jgi:hypothetical protein
MRKQAVERRSRQTPRLLDRLIKISKLPPSGQLEGFERALRGLIQRRCPYFSSSQIPLLDMTSCLLGRFFTDLPSAGSRMLPWQVMALIEGYFEVSVVCGLIRARDNRGSSLNILLGCY